MKRFLFAQIAALISLGSIAEARIESPGAVTTGPFHHAAAVAHQKVRLHKTAPQPQVQATPNEKAAATVPVPAKEKQSLRKRLFGPKVEAKSGN